jgi:hypothetical protein
VAIDQPIAGHLAQLTAAYHCASESTP